ncbi:MAG: N-acetyltransferase [Chloroflexi bacterium]|nr:MAG: N-acetyltransferase [Chloroflexota bacterium]
MQISYHHLRPAAKDDAAAIKALIRAVNINPMGIKWQRFVVAVDENGRLLGCGQIKPHRDGSWELASIAVQPKFQHQGIARAIITHLCNNHSGSLWLTCINRLAPFYEKYGFVEETAVAHMPPYFRNARRFFQLYQILTRTPDYLAVMKKP